MIHTSLTSSVTNKKRVIPLLIIIVIIIIKNTYDNNNNNHNNLFFLSYLSSVSRISKVTPGTDEERSHSLTSNIQKKELRKEPNEDLLPSKSQSLVLDTTSFMGNSEDI